MNFSKLKPKSQVTIFNDVLVAFSLKRGDLLSWKIKDESICQEDVSEGPGLCAGSPGWPKDWVTDDQELTFG